MIGDQVPDIEVGRHALRTFRIVKKERRQFKTMKQSYKLRSVFKDYYWNSNGTIEAECLSVDIYDRHAPGMNENCHCGVYGSLNLDVLHTQYPDWTPQTVAVIAAEGPTLIGEKGLRTSAARIVAFWVADPADAEAYANVENVKAYLDIKEMLKDYDFPEYEGQWPPEKKVEKPDWGINSIRVGSYTMSNTSSLSTSALAGIPLHMRLTQKDLDDIVNALSKTMGTSTSGGRDAIKHALKHLL
jgi:hypothetical protein